MIILFIFVRRQIHQKILLTNKYHILLIKIRIQFYQHLLTSSIPIHLDLADNLVPCHRIQDVNGDIDPFLQIANVILGTVIEAIDLQILVHTETSIMIHDHAKDRRDIARSRVQNRDPDLPNDLDIHIDDILL